MGLFEIFQTTRDDSELEPVVVHMDENNLLEFDTSLEASNPLNISAPIAVKMVNHIVVKSAASAKTKSFKRSFCDKLGHRSNSRRCKDYGTTKGQSI